MGVNSFRTAWQTRNLDAWADALAPDVVLRSPILTQPFVGRDVAIELYGVLFDVLGTMDVVHELSGDDGAHAFFWRADVGGHTIEGADLLHYNAAGEITEATVLIRPLVNIATFAAAVGPPLAAKQSRARGSLARILTLPLRGLFMLIDVLSMRLAQRR